jgi:hypothetical protein
MAKSTTTKPEVPAIPTVADCEQVLRDLEEKRTRLQERRTKIESETCHHAYAAHARGDLKAIEAIDDIAERIRRTDFDLKTVNLAINEAQERLDEAQAAEAAKADKAAALALREEVQEFCQIGMRMDKALADFIEASAEWRESLIRMHAKGSSFPSDTQIEVLGYAVLQTVLRQTLWARRFEAIAPNQRRNFTGLCMGWHETIERGIAQRLGEDTPQAEPVQAAAAPEQGTRPAPKMQRQSAEDAKEAAEAQRTFLGR